MADLVIGDGIRQYCQDLGLEPFTHSWYETKGESQQETVLTKQGYVIASNDTGEWVVAGPFGQTG